MEIKDKVVVITGGANGIGKACAQELHKTYANIIIADIDRCEIKICAGRKDEPVE